MNTSMSWLKNYVPDLDVPPKEYCDAMTLSGTKVENFRQLDRDLYKIVVGLVKTCLPHPDSDHLHVCTVDVGSGEDLQIVCGAPNVKEGLKVPVVLVGGRVAGSHNGDMTEGGISIKAGKLRGVESFGMICSIEELGASREYYPEAPEGGIYLFPKETAVGADAIALLGLHDTVVEYEITSNRVDCYSVLGIAREAAATFGKKFCPPVVKETGNSEDVKEYIDVEVRDFDLCPRYCARVVKNVKIAPSPVWMQRCLSSVGIRPINNIVDITNFVMEEYGQPMHSFDYDTVAGHKIIVRRAKDGEEFTTLDGQKRKMDSDVLMICDAEKEIGIAGIMGGENSMITDSVQNVLFEAACFNGTNIRLSSKRIGLQTDASGKFDKGLDPNSAFEAIQRACELMEEFGAGEVVGGIVDIHQELPQSVSTPFEPEKINALLGTGIDAAEMIGIFEREGLTYDREKNAVIAPTFRQDLHRMYDYAEEVARFSGYANIPTTLPSGQATYGGLQFHMKVEDIARETAEQNGFCQGFCYSFESPKVFDRLLLPENDKARDAIRIMNPLGEDFSVMRTLSLNGILTSLATNANRRNKSVRLYELGNIYLPKSLPLTELPEERMQLTLGMYGDGGFFEMKGVLEMILLKLGMKEKPEYVIEDPKPYLHPGRQASVRYNGKTIAFFGEVHPGVRKNYGIDERAYLADIDLPSLCGFASFDRKYTGIPKYPAMTRDISITAPREITNAEIEAVIEQRGGKILESCVLFDVYEGPPILPGFRSMAYNLTFRHTDKTLDENEVGAAMKKILNGLEDKKITLR